MQTESKEVVIKTFRMLAVYMIALSNNCNCNVCGLLRSEAKNVAEELLKIASQTPAAQS